MQEKKQANRLILLCAFVYFVSYTTRNNYAAIIAEMVSGMGQSKSALATALTGSFITYGAGQLVSGYFGDRVQPRYLVTAGLTTTVAMNLLIPLCGNPAQMTLVWCVNGFAQAFLWPPLVKLMATQLSREQYAVGCVRVSWGGSLGTICIYLTSPFLIRLFGWKSVFFGSAAIGSVGILLWHRCCPMIRLAALQTEEKQGMPRKKFMLPLLSVFLVVLVQGILRDGVSTWMPSYIAEVCGFNNETAILVGGMLPVFAMLSQGMTGSLQRKWLHNEFVCAAVIFGLGAVAAGLLCLPIGQNAAMSVLCMSLLAGCMHGVNLLLTCVLPPRLTRGNRQSVVSGAVNSIVYAGSALSAYAIPLATEHAGWQTTLQLWLVLSVVGTLMCAICVPAWKKAD